ncbi:MAG: glucose-6-phosphate dehydrogenase (NADP(+)), partial [Planctomycetota bacterium]
MGKTIVIFGAAGDLTRRKLIPALYRLFEKGRLSQDTRVLGISRSPFTDGSWREALRESVSEFIGNDLNPHTWQRFADQVFYQSGDVNGRDCFRKLEDKLAQHETGGDAGRVYYLATAPGLYRTAIENLGVAGMADESRGRRCIVVEKPFGVDAQSARALNDCLHAVFEERQVFRIDHYLGKETVQNLMVLRFANSIFEPIWNWNYV